MTVAQINLETTFTHHTAKLKEVELHYVIGGTGQPLILLHGWPSNWYEWRRIMPELAAKYQVIAVDTRGLGDSSKPEGGYDKKTVAGDIFELVQQLNLPPAYLVGHDLGGQVAYAYASEYPENVTQMAILDTVILGLANSDRFNPWHFSFHNLPNLPEILVAGKEREYLSHFYNNPQYVHSTTCFADEEIDEFVRAYTTPGAMKAGFEYYRAFERDAEDNQKYAQTKLKMPILAIGGANSLGNFLYQQVREVGENVRGEIIDYCGHWLPIERPKELTKLLLDFS